ncbi:sporulation protein YtxC [Neobacillus sp. SM06]|uniref:sporulation protein YtxC n=1 Tax=Neobacillus sp. SM06 TaxID=3422492 RepID=UPI003D27A163
MAEIIFQNKDDSEKFYHHLLNELGFTVNESIILHNEDRYIVKISEQQLSKNQMEKVKAAFCQFILTAKRDDWFRAILQQRYFYTDPYEVQQIMEIVYSILAGQREDLAAILKRTIEDEQIKEAVDHVFQENISLQFESFSKFRLRTYFDILENYVGISIDEYKMEQEYQMFVQTLRDFLKNRQAQIPVLHLFFDEEIMFFHADFTEIKRAELVKMIDRKLLFNHPVYIDSASIAPLLSIAPAKIFFYVKDPEAPLVRTIKNIFEERVILKPLQAFAKKDFAARMDQS